LYMQERYDEARQAFERAYAAQPDDASLPLLVSLCYKKSGKEADARRVLNQVVGKLDRESWQYEVARFYLNPSNDFYIVSATSKEKRASVKYRLLFYLASQNLLLNKKSSALSYFAEVAEVASKLVFRTPSVEKMLSEWELGKLEKTGAR
jgi:lipoprotein NlpI